MSNVDYKEPRLFCVSGYRIFENDEGMAFTLDVNVRSVAEAVEQVEYIYSGQDIRIVAVRPVV